jgi:hypothetical protein
MKIFPIQKVIQESNIVVFSPHFDDFLFMLGGYAGELKKVKLLGTKKFHVNILFSNSNYLAGDGAGNFDSSLDRIKLATGKRIIEDRECLDELLGRFGYRYELYGENECFVRGKSFANSEMEFPHGMFENFDETDNQIFNRMKKLVREWIVMTDTALIFPLAIKEHIDHFIVREAALEVANEYRGGANARFYFQEDKPYGGIATNEELTRIEEFINENKLENRLYKFDPESIIDFAFRHYVSQVEEVYKKGIRDRALYWQNRLNSSFALDRICLYL